MGQGTYTKVVEFVGFKKRLAGSHTLAAARAEVRSPPGLRGGLTRVACSK